MTEHLMPAFSHRTLSRCLLAASVWIASCGGGGGDVADTGSGTGNGGGTGTSDQPYTGLTSALSAHPRLVYSGTRKTQLSALTTSAAYLAYKSKFDDKLAAGPGNTSWSDLGIWHMALLSQTTGDPKYCARAIADADAKVASDADFSNISRDSFLRISEDLEEILLTFDLCHSAVSGSQKRRWVDYANTALDRAWASNSAHWPYDDAHNNYWYAFLEATLLVGIATDGDNPRSVEFQKLFGNKVLQVLRPAWNTPLWAGPGGKEGTHYDKWTRRLWQTLDWWRTATGQDLFNNVNTSMPEQLNYWLHQFTPDRDHLFQWGDEPNDSEGRLGASGRELLLILMGLAPNSTQAQHAKDLLANSPWSSFRARSDLPLAFLYDTSEVTPSSILNKTDLYLHTPTNGAGKTFIRDSWSTTASAVSYSYRARSGPSSSHDHSEKPAFQWHANGEFVVVNPNFYSVSGVVGTSNNGGAQLANIVRLEGVDGDSESTTPTTVLHERNVAATGNVPRYYYHAFDVHVAWPDTSVYRRDYLYFEPNVMVIFDHITSKTAMNKVWQVNTPTAPVFSGSLATVSGAKNTLRIIDALPSATAIPPSARSWKDNPGFGTSFTGGWRTSYGDTATDYYSVKVLDIANRVSSANCTRNLAIVTCTLVMDGASRTVTFGDDSTGATIN